MKTMTGFDVNDPSFDKLKYIRQLRCVINWKNSKARSTTVAATGFGKSTIALIAIAKMLKRDKDSFLYKNSVLIVVPTIKLKKQWLGILSKCGFDHVDVEVTNTVALNKDYYGTYDLMILDEVHEMVGDEFRKVLTNVKYSWIMCLTATLKRMDEKHNIITKIAPVSDVITQAEAIEKGWISDFIEFNLPVSITRSESEELVKLGNSIRYFMSKFGDNAFDKMKNCMNRKNANTYASASGNDPQEVIKWAIQGMAAIRRRKDFLDNTIHKVDATVELIDEFDLRTITFSESINFVNAVQKRLGDECKVYHSKIASEKREFKKEKFYTTRASAIKFKEKMINEGTPAKFRKVGDKRFRVTWFIEKSVSGSKIAEENSKMFEDGDVNVLVTAKALDKGYDVPSIDLGIDASRSANPTQHQQRTGRVARNYTLPNGMKAIKIYINLYIPDYIVPNSKDESKLKNCQQNTDPSRIHEVDDLDELKEVLKALIKTRRDKEDEAVSNAA